MYLWTRKIENYLTSLERKGRGRISQIRCSVSILSTNLAILLFFQIFS